jgi:hypothetical protein
MGSPNKWDMKKGEYYFLLALMYYVHTHVGEQMHAVRYLFEKVAPLAAILLVKHQENFHSCIM